MRVSFPITMSRSANAWTRRLAPLLTLVLVLAAWQLVFALRLYPTFLIPSPQMVWEKAAQVLRDGTLWAHLLATSEAMVWGLLWGVSIGTLLGYLIAKLPLAEVLLTPLIVAFQATPIVAYAPLLIIWFGSGMTSKVVTCAVIVFFPTLMNTVVGVRQIPPRLRDLMRALSATRWQTLCKLELPAILPVWLTGLKTSATLAVIGVVVGEFLSADRGLGHWVKLARSQYDTALVFVGVLTMTALALTFYSLVYLLEWRLLKWQRQSRSV